jgi:hypothetical protein
LAYSKLNFGIKDEKPKDTGAAKKGKDAKAPAKKKK